jgi:hypothetical protein
VNTEELEVSLKREFENYLKGIIAEMRQETAEFQDKMQAEFDKQKASFDEAFASFTSRFESDKNFDEAFTSSVSEHLRLARDEGAKITAEAFAEAEKLEKEHAPPAAAAKYDNIRDAVNDISSKGSQATILKALVNHAAEFAPRGAFFIIKSEQFTGWKVFGDDTHAAEAAIRDLSFPISADTMLGAAVRSVNTVESSPEGHSENPAFLDDLGFGRPDRMFAIPLVARGKAVAVLYADQGKSDSQLHPEALETLVRVAGLTVELAAAQSTKYEAHSPESSHIKEPTPVSYFEQTPVASPVVTAPNVAFSDSSVVNEFRTPEPEVVQEEVYEPVSSHEEVAVVEESFVNEQIEPVETIKETSFETVSDFDVQPKVEEVKEFATETIEFQPETIIEPVSDFTPSGSPFDATVEEIAPAVSSNDGYQVAHEPAVEVAAPVAATTGSRLSDRNVDLPIEVPEEERRSHNDARRFARLLVSEIKLYNEKKVIEGREASDLYPRLREAIDRSREMYDKRVQPPVASKFDYFHYELVNSLAEGDAARLGSGYPGATV